MSAYRSTYQGPKRRLVIAFDVGNIHSCVSYAILGPGKTPKIETVSRWPGQEAGDSMIATVVYYDSEGRMIAAGDESPDLHEDDDEDRDATEPYKVEWFKFMLNPPTTTLHPTVLPPLPPEKTIEMVYADFYGYLFRQTRRYIIEIHNALGAPVWDSVSGDIAFIMTHPTGWEETQRSVMRAAVIRAGLVPDTPGGHERINFVTEGEASLHFCISSGILSDAIEIGANIMLIDAGDRTVEVTAYSLDSVAPIESSNLVAPACIVEGSAIVTRRARSLLENKLAGSSSVFGTAQKRFKGSGDAILKFSDLITDADAKCGIRNGRIKLTVAEISSFFDPAVRAIIKTIEDQERRVQCGFSIFILIGSFAANEYLFQKLRDHFDDNDSNAGLYRSDTHTNKAVSEGAVSFFIDHHVATRTAKFTYGLRCAYVYDHNQPDHVQRASKVFSQRGGMEMLENGFRPMLFRGTRVREEVEFAYPFQAASRLGTNRIECEIVCYSGDRSPVWIDEDPENFAALATIAIDASRITRVAQRGSSCDYYHQDYTVVLSFNLTEIKAYLTWMEKGVKRESQACLIPEYPSANLNPAIIVAG